VLWGVVAGIVTTWLLIICGLLIKQVIIPWYQQLVYRGIDLSGTWQHVFELNGGRYRFDIHLQQSAHRLVGTVTKSKSGTQDDYSHTFNCSGSVSDGFVVLNLESTDRSSLSLGTTLLKIFETGERLKGYVVYRGRKNDEIEWVPADWKRKN